MDSPGCSLSFFVYWLSYPTQLWTGILSQNVRLWSWTVKSLCLDKTQDLQKISVGRDFLLKLHAAADSVCKRPLSVFWIPSFPWPCQLNAVLMWLFSLASSFLWFCLWIRQTYWKFSWLIRPDLVVRFEKWISFHFLGCWRFSMRCFYSVQPGSVYT